MPSTSIYGWSTPAAADDNDVPTDLASLAGQIETTVDGLTTFAVARRLVKTDTQSVAHSTYTSIVGWTGGTGDPGNVVDGITYSNGVFTVPTAGRYLIGMGSYIEDNATGDRILAFRHNGTLAEATFTARRGGTLWIVKDCAANDTLEIQVRQTSGVSLLFGGSTNFGWYQCARVA